MRNVQKIEVTGESQYVRHGSAILGAGFDEGLPVVWILEDDSMSTWNKRTFVSFYTGEPIPDDTDNSFDCMKYDYIGSTHQINGRAIHIFEVVEE